MPVRICFPKAPSIFSGDRRKLSRLSPPSLQLAHKRKVTSLFQSLFSCSAFRSGHLIPIAMSNWKQLHFGADGCRDKTVWNHNKFQSLFGVTKKTSYTYSLFHPPFPFPEETERSCGGKQRITKEMLDTTYSEISGYSGSKKASTEK